jgi:hypothetical protein
MISFRPVPANRVATSSDDLCRAAKALRQSSIVTDLSSNTRCFVVLSTADLFRRGGKRWEEVGSIYRALSQNDSERRQDNGQHTST